MYELVFAGAADAASGAYGYRFPRYKRVVSGMEEAAKEASRVFRALNERGLPWACHSPILYGPGCGDCGRVVGLN